MKSNFFAITFILSGLFANAQTANTWKGGTPGHENDWNIAANWSLGEVPNATHDVVIPNDGIFPVLAGKTVEINSLQMQPGAELTLKGDARVALPTSVLFAQATICWDARLGRFGIVSEYAKR